MKMESDKQIAGRDYENLVMRQENSLLKGAEQRALPPGSTLQNVPEMEARIAALEKEVYELKRQIEELKKR